MTSIAALAIVQLVLAFFACAPARAALVSPVAIIVYAQVFAPAISQIACISTAAFRAAPTDSPPALVGVTRMRATAALAIVELRRAPIAIAPSRVALVCPVARGTVC